jgi:Dolichyl-phosphate-mannose-protein mannosyltransferase
LRRRKGYFVTIPLGRRLLIFGFLLVLFLLLITRNVSSEPYVYDEADYMYAASLGFIANWSDTPSIPIADFARAGISRASRQALSKQIRNGNDALFYRHFHGPLFHYLLIPVSRFGWNERGVRTALLIIPAASLAVIYFGCQPLIGAFLAAVLFLSSYSVIGSTELAPHQLFALCSLGCLILLAKAISTGRRAYWYGCIVASGLAFCTLEVAFVLILTVAICGFVERRRWQVDGRFVAQSAGTFLATVLIIWPAAILRLSFMKAYAVLAYLALMREPWGHVGFIDTWRARILDSPFEWALILLGVMLWIGNRRRSIYPIGLFATLMLLATLRVLTSTPRYALVFVPALDLLAGLALVPSLGPLRRPASFAVVALAVAGLYVNACYQVVNQPRNPNPRSAAVQTYIHQNELQNKAILAPQADLPALHYYFPGMRLRGYFGEAPTAADRVGFAADAILPAPDLLR